MPHVNAVAMVEMFRNGKAQRLLAIRATCTVNVANAKHVRTLASRCSGHCF
jgi:hypothetical protein